MPAYYEVETNIPSNHQLQIQLPDIVPIGRIKVSVLYELPDLPTKKTEDLINAIKNFRIKSRYPAKILNRYARKGVRVSLKSPL
jgi:hypothetical protein